MKAFLFGGESNGQTFEVQNHVQDVIMPKGKYVSTYASHSDNAVMQHETERYIRYSEKFRKRLNNSGVVLEMEDLGIFIHESITNNERESLSKIIIMVINAQWKPRQNDH